MSRFAEKEVRPNTKDEDKAKAIVARRYIQASRDYREIFGEITLPFSEDSKKVTRTKSKATTEKEIERLLLVQAVEIAFSRFTDLSFHTILYPELSEEEARIKYAESFKLPKDARISKEYRERLPVINVSDPRIPVWVKDEKAEVKEWIDTKRIRNNVLIPDRPHIAFTHDGTRYQPYTVTQAIERFAKDEEGEPYTETIDLYITHPEFFRTRGRDSAGSRSGGGIVPYLDTLNGCPGVGVGSPGNPDVGYGAGSRGKKLIILGS